MSNLLIQSLSESNQSRCLRQYKRHVKSGNPHVIFIGKDQADVFVGAGWGHRSRYRLVKGRWCLISGVPVLHIDILLHHD